MQDFQCLSVDAPLEKWAAFYAAHQLPVIPLYEPTLEGGCSCKNPTCPSPGKHPRVKNGLKDGTTDLNTIQKWWKKWPRANIGIITGQASHVVVLDIDPKNGGINSLEQLYQEFGFFDTTQVLTGSSGFHFYFSIDRNIQLKNKVNIRPGVDLRAENGYIVAPPSLHVSGKVYQWQKDLSSISCIPHWLEELCRQKKVDYHSLRSVSTNVFKKANQNNNTIAEGLIGIGQRNTFLSSIAGIFRKYGLSLSLQATALQLINENCCYPKLESSEVDSVSQSIGRYHASAMLTEDWPELKDIAHSGTHKLPALEISYLPIGIRDWIVDIATRMQISYEMIAVPALVGIGSVIGRKIRVYPKKYDSWSVAPNIWGAVIARPGTFKSPAIAEALAPLEKIVAKENDLYQKKLRDWEAEKSCHLAILDALKDQLIRAIKKDQLQEAEVLKEKIMTMQKDISSKIPKCKRLKTNDVTMEKVVEILIENPNGLLMVRDELSGWIAALAKPGYEGVREFWLETWASRSSYTVDRIGRGTVHVPNLSLSVFGGIQPDKLERLLTSSLDSNDDGLLQRLQLLVFPQTTEHWINHDVLPNLSAQKDVEALFERIHDFLPSDGETSFKSVHFDEQAQNEFDLWRTKLEASLRCDTSGNIHYDAHLSKYRSLIPALGLIFEILSAPQTPLRDISSVGHESLLLAIRWSEYLIAHAKEIYKVDRHPFERSVHTLTEKIRAGKLQDGITIRSLGRKCWQDLQSMDQIEHALEVLSQHNWLRILEPTAYVGRPTRQIQLHPSLIISS